MTAAAIERKLAKLFALARCPSATPAEAAAALRQAQALQRQLSASASTAPVIDITGRLSVGLRLRGQPTAVAARLAELVAHLHNGVVVCETAPKSHVWRVWANLPSDRVVCDYVLTVLYRRMVVDTNRAGVGRRTGRAARVAAFQAGWIAGLYEQHGLKMATVHSLQHAAARALPGVGEIWLSPVLTSTLRAEGRAAGLSASMPSPALPG